MIISVEAEQKKGKTTFAYTGPLPIVGFSFDMGIERALQGSRHHWFEGLKIHVEPWDRETVIHATAASQLLWKPGQKAAGADIIIYELPPPIQLGSILVKGVRELWEHFSYCCSEALQDFNIQCTVIDTGTLARRVKADAYLQSLQESWIAAHEGNAKRGIYEEGNSKMRERLIQIEWAAANDAMRDIYATAQGLHKNLVVTHHLTDERKEVLVHNNGRTEKENVATGERILEGLANTPRYVDIAMRIDTWKDPAVVGAPTQLVAKIQNCGYNLDLEGDSIPNPTWDKVADRVMMSLGGRLQLPKSGRNLVSVVAS